jgi:hypothetical protein
LPIERLVSCFLLAIEAMAFFLIVVVRIGWTGRVQSLDERSAA